MRNIATTQRISSTGMTTPRPMMNRSWSSDTSEPSESRPDGRAPDPKKIERGRQKSGVRNDRSGDRRILRNGPDNGSPRHRKCSHRARRRRRWRRNPRGSLTRRCQTRWWRRYTPIARKTQRPHSIGRRWPTRSTTGRERKGIGWVWVSRSGSRMETPLPRKPTAEQLLKVDVHNAVLHPACICGNRE